MMKMQLQQQGFMDSQTGELFPVWVARTAHGDWIHDPYVHQDGRCGATPKDHGLTDEEAAALVKQNEAFGFRWKLDW